MSGHTPGPWEVGTVSDGEDFVGSVYAQRDGIRVAMVYMLIDGTELRPREEDEANARLIAEAPDLLEFCRAFIERIEEDGEPTPGTRWHAEYIEAKRLRDAVAGDRS